MKVTASNVIRWSGFAALAAGIVFAAIQPIHPADEVASVNTTAWAIITPLKTVMALFFLVGITGLFARQVDQAGWLGLAGFLMFGLSWAFNFAFIFAEAFILPELATISPKFVDGVLGISFGRASEVSLGALPALYSLLSILFLLGGLLFGIATYRAGVLPRWAALLFAASCALTPAAALLPHNIQRLAGVPIGLTFAWLGFALLFEKRSAAQPAHSLATSQLRQTGAD
jgi:hypothetical protein